MSLATAKYFQHDGEPPPYHLEPGWQEISKGLGVVALGYTILVAGGLVGPLLIWLALDGDAVLGALGAAQADRDGLLLLGVGALGLTAVLSYALVLTGHWRCLMYAPERQNAKGLMYLCIHTVFLASILTVAGVALDGGRSYAALGAGLDAVLKLAPHSPGVLLLLASAALGLFSSLIFSAFLRTVASCFGDQARVRGVDLNLALVGLLLGGSAGIWFYAPGLALHAGLLPWLGGGWLTCFAWHLVLVRGVRRCVNEGLGQAVLVRVLPAPKSTTSGVLPLHSLSGLRRLAHKGAQP